MRRQRELPPWERLFSGNGVLQSLAGLEHGPPGGGHLDDLQGLGVAALTGSPLTALEGAKAHQLNLLTAHQSVGEGVQLGGDSLLAVLLGHTGFFYHGGNQFSFVHIFLSSLLIPSLLG